MALTSIFKYVLHATCTSELKTDEAVNYCGFLVTKVLKNLKDARLTEHFSVYSHKSRTLKSSELNAWSAADFKPQDSSSPHQVPFREQEKINSTTHFPGDQTRSQHTTCTVDQEWVQRA